MKKTLAALGLMLSLAVRAQAEPVTAGMLAMDWQGVGQLTLTCSGLTFNGTVGANDGIYTAWRLSPATASDGALVDMGGYWTGLAVRGAVNDGLNTIPVGSDAAWGDLRFRASIALPSAAEGTVAWLNQPFTFSGFFKLPYQSIGVAGDGILSAQFRRGPDSWDLRTANYAFNQPTDMTPNPEPATMLLGLTGLGMVWLRKQRSL